MSKINIKTNINHFLISIESYKILMLDKNVIFKNYILLNIFGEIY